MEYAIKCPLCDGIGSYERPVDTMSIAECGVCEGSGTLVFNASTDDTNDHPFSTYPERVAFAAANWAYSVMLGEHSMADKYIVENIERLSCFVTPRTADICSLALDILDEHTDADRYTLPQWVFLIEQGVKQCAEHS